MTEPAKDETELLERVIATLWSYQGAHHAEIAFAAIREAGWAVVPVEATDEMMWAGENLPAPLWEMDNSDHSQFVLSLRRAEWAAMIAAAPGVKL